jgi:hypothetical protein
MVLPAKWVSALSRLSLIFVLLASPALSAEVGASAKKVRKPVVLPTGVVQKTMALPAVGTTTVYMPADLSRAKRVVLFLSGDGGWELGVIDMALRMAPAAVVAGISVPSYQRANSTGSSAGIRRASSRRQPSGSRSLQSGLSVSGPARRR